MNNNINLNIEDHIPMGFIYMKLFYNEKIKSKDFKIIKVNDYLLKLFKENSLLFNKNNLFDLLNELDISISLETFNKLVEVSEAENNLDNKEILYYENKIYSINYFSPEKNYLVLLIKDITEKRKNYDDLIEKNKQLETLQKILMKNIEDLEEKNYELIKQKNEYISLSKSKNILFSNISHDIKTPINGIISLTNLLKDEINDERYKKYLNMIKLSSNQLIKIINDIIEYKKLDDNYYKIQNTDFNLNSLIQDIKEIYLPLFENKNISFFVVSDKEYIVRTDYVKLRQILLNFISNSIKYTVKGSITIKIHSKNKDFIISINDTGKGIPGKFQKLIFKEYSSFDIELMENKSHGIGLAISKELAKILKAKIIFESKINHGTTFSLIFKLENIIKNNSFNEKKNKTRK